MIEPILLLLQTRELSLGPWAHIKQFFVPRQSESIWRDHVPGHGRENCGSGQWIGTVEVNRDTGFEPGESQRQNVSPALSPASQFTSTVSIHPVWRYSLFSRQLMVGWGQNSFLAGLNRPRDQRSCSLKAETRYSWTRFIRFFRCVHASL